MRKIDTARATLGGFQGMAIGTANGNDEDGIRKYLMKSNQLAREFVRNHSDMAMSHIAAFQKSYHRAAQDVALLIDESGTYYKKIALLHPREIMGLLKILFMTFVF